MFSAVATATYVWDAKAHKFISLDAERAEAVEEAMSGGGDYLVEHFLAELLGYADGFPGQCGPWLRFLRSECSVEANRLLVDSLIARN